MSDQDFSVKLKINNQKNVFFFLSVWKTLNVNPSNTEGVVEKKKPLVFLPRQMGGFALYIKKNINLCESMSLYIYFYCIGETPRWSSTFLDRYMIYELLSLAVKAYAYSILRHC